MKREKKGIFQIGTKIKARRKALGLTQEKLAELINCSFKTIGNIENDNTIPDTRQVINLCDILNMSFDELFSDVLKKKDDNFSMLSASSLAAADSQSGDEDLENDDLLEGYEAVATETVPEYIVKKKETTETTVEENDIPQAPDLSEYENLWKRNDVPKEGWVCVGVTDLGAPVGVCEMCGHQIIRYVHHMQHPQYRSLGVGCICAGKMEGDIEQAKQREQEYKNKQTRRENFKKRKWKTSKNNNSYIIIKNHLIVLYYNKRFNNWKYSIDNVFCPEVYSNREEAMDGAFEALEKKM